jgi:hypothetical protein
MAVQKSYDAVVVENSDEEMLQAMRETNEWVASTTEEHNKYWVEAEKNGTAVKLARVAWETMVKLGLTCDDDADWSVSNR